MFWCTLLADDVVPSLVALAVTVAELRIVRERRTLKVNLASGGQTDGRTDRGKKCEPGKTSKSTTGSRSNEDQSFMAGSGVHH